jgi:hypothetical protein
MPDALGDYRERPLRFQMVAHREFELLVTRIEGALAPVGAVTRSPDYVVDNFTGRQREVDASIRYTVGSVNLLITVECRDRARTEDVTWIEQLATKQKQIGAAHTIAVSSTGFSEPALSAAKLHGISTRRISEVSNEDILAWVDTLEVSEVNTTCELGRMSLVYDGVYPGAHLDATLEQEFNDLGWDAAIFIDLRKDSGLSLRDLVSRAVRDKVQPMPREANSIALSIAPRGSVSILDEPLAVMARDVPTDGSTIEKTFWFEMLDEQIAVKTNHGTLNLQKLGFEVKMCSTLRRVPASRVISYSGDGGLIADIAERQVDFGKKSDRLMLTQYRRAEPDTPVR